MIYMSRTYVKTQSACLR